MAGAAQAPDAGAEIELELLIDGLSRGGRDGRGGGCGPGHGLKYNFSHFASLRGLPD